VLSDCSYWRPSSGRSVRRLVFLIVAITGAFPLISQWRPSGNYEDGFALIFFLTPPYYEGHPLWSQGDELSHPINVQSCPYSRCRITSNPAFGDRANLIIFQGPFAKRCCVRTDSGDVVCSNGNRTSELNFTLPRVSPTTLLCSTRKNRRFGHPSNACDHLTITLTTRGRTGSTQICSIAMVRTHRSEVPIRCRRQTQSSKAATGRRTSCGT